MPQNQNDLTNAVQERPSAYLKRQTFVCHSDNSFLAVAVSEKLGHFC